MAGVGASLDPVVETDTVGALYAADLATLLARSTRARSPQTRQKVVRTTAFAE